ncbi:tetratricopeptide repeat protein [Rhabdochromatium marinum]|uniref:tetratricopeptide repeat protein n=1 Tax=Rhabdochromatium marinum TaxID=48729 RepID=UPI001906C546|nr:tetratricopeptide repeat protein [Rhabdochromatium marinum]
MNISDTLHEAIQHHSTGDHQEALRLYHAILTVQPDHPVANHNIAVIAENFGQTDTALQFFNAAVQANPQEPHFWQSYLEILVRCGHMEQAQTQLKAARAAGVDDLSLQPPEALLAWGAQMQDTNLFEHHLQAATEHFPGTPYTDWLDWFHRTLKPATYLEIGVETGQTLQQAQPPTHCIGIDPQPLISVNLSAWTKIYAQTSDDFFRQHSIQSLFDGARIDFCFIDGYHSFDQALRDFVNVEANAHEKSVVLFHDIYPIDPSTAARQRHTKFWVGDTWKVIPLLKEQRPDLSITTIPTYPSGLAMVTGLNPNNDALRVNIQTLIETWTTVEYQDYADIMPSTLNLIENRESDVLAALQGVLDG